MSSKRTIKKNQIRQDCWNLDHAWLKWMREHLKVYLHDASKIVDLTYNKFTYKDKEYTQEEVIKHMIALLERNRHRDVWDGDAYLNDIDELLDLWKLVFHAMWW